MAFSINKNIKRTRKIRSWIEKLALGSMIFDFAIASLTLLGNNLNNLTVTVSSNSIVLSTTNIDLSFIHSIVNWGLTAIMVVTGLLFLLWLGLKYENKAIEKKLREGKKQDYTH